MTIRTRIAAIGLALFTMASVGLAQSPSGTTITGHLLDAVCAKNHATEAGYKENHEKSCSLMDVCVKTGFALVTADNKVLKFDERGNQMALDLVKKTNREKDWNVAVTGRVVGDTVTVTAVNLR